MKKAIVIWMLILTFMMSSVTSFAASKEYEESVVLVVVEGEYDTYSITGFVIGEDHEGYYIMTSFFLLEAVEDDIEDADYEVYVDEDNSLRADFVYGPDEFEEEEILDTYLTLILKTRDKDVKLTPLQLNTEKFDEDDLYTVGFEGDGAYFDEDEYDFDRSDEDITVSDEEVSYMEKVDYYMTEEYFDMAFVGAPVFDENDLVVGFMGVDEAQGFVEIRQIIGELEDEGIPYNTNYMMTLIMYGAIGCGLIAVVIVIIAIVLKKRKPTKTEPAIEPNVSQKTVAARLTGLSGHYAGQTIPLNSSAVVFGRDTKVCHLLYPKEMDTISRKHCEIIYSNPAGKFMLIDYSTRGTFLNGKKMNKNQPYPLEDGSTFYLSESAQVFKFN